MPNRIIRDSCRTSKTLDGLSAGAECLFWRLTTTADDLGRFEADVRVVKAACYPLRVEILNIKKVAAWLDEIESVGLVHRYNVEERVYGVFVSWAKHQRLRNSAPKYPGPDDAADPIAMVYVAKRGDRIKIGFTEGPVETRLKALRIEPDDLLGAFPGNRDLEKALHDQFATFRIEGEWFQDVPAIHDAVALLCCQTETSGVKGKHAASKENMRGSRDVSVSVSVSDSALASAPEEECADFATFWAAYPHKVAKRDAERAFAKLKPTVALLAMIVADVQERARGDPKWTSDGGQYIPYPATYLNGKRWKDERLEKRDGFTEFYEHLEAKHA